MLRKKLPDKFISMDLIMYKGKDTRFNGVLNYIQENHSEIIPKYKEWGQLTSFIKKLERRFLIENKIPYKRNHEHNAVSENWDKFIIFLKAQ